MSASLTPYALALVADGLGQIAGHRSAPLVAPTYAAAIAIDSGPDGGNVQTISGVNATSATCALTTTLPAAVNKVLWLILKAADGTVTYSFGTGFKATGNAAPTVGTMIAVGFVSDGTNFVEFARSDSAITS